MPFFGTWSRACIPTSCWRARRQCFPFYVYDEDGSNRRENITDWALQLFREHYQDPAIGKWDIFYYVYGVLHHPGYRAKFADNLKRELPRIPLAPPLGPNGAKGAVGFSPRGPTSIATAGAGANRANEARPESYSTARLKPAALLRASGPSRTRAASWRTGTWITSRSSRIRCDLWRRRRSGAASGIRPGTGAEKGMISTSENPPLAPP